jgi:hypothetical protein
LALFEIGDLQMRHRLYTEQDGTIRPYNGLVHPNLPWEDTVFVIDTQDENRIVARYDEGTAFPNNPLTQALNGMRKLEKEICK